MSDWRRRGIVRRYKSAAKFRQEVALLPGVVAIARFQEDMRKRWKLRGDG